MFAYLRLLNAYRFLVNQRTPLQSKIPWAIGAEENRDKEEKDLAGFKLQQSFAVRLC